MSKIEVGELYEATANITGLTEYGASFEDITSGKALPPPEGARFDVAFEGTLTGEKLKGKVKGVDYVWMRADGRVEVDIHAEVTADNGQRLSFKATGVNTPRKDTTIFDLKQNVTLFSSHKDYTWVNTLQVWAIGTVDLATQVINVKGYSS